MSVPRDLPASPLAVREAGMRAAVFSRGIRKIPFLEGYFDFCRIRCSPSNEEADDIDVVLTWGNRETGRRALAYAERHRKPVWRLEDGFFRSIHPGTQEPPLSLVLDDLGIYYDARTPSRLETLLSHAGEDDPLQSDALLERAGRLLDFVRGAGLSKYNNGRSLPISLEASQRRRVLVVDQTEGDASIQGALAEAGSFEAMLEWVLREFSGQDILLKLHPEVVSGKKRGCVAKHHRADPRITVLSSNPATMDLLGQVDHVVTVSSQLGFDALCAGKPATCFGAPFYAGWGLTDDRIEVPRRQRKRSLHELFAAAVILYPRYVDPVSGERCDPEFALEHLARQRTAAVANEGRTYAVGFSGWKRPFVKPFLNGPNSEVSFVRERTLTARLNGSRPDRVVTWGQRMSCATHSALLERGIPVLYMEDGFLRSNTLGSELSRPLSVVLDSRGIYYDATRPSDLEVILQSHEFSERERNAGRALIEAVRSRRLSKYNVQDDSPLVLPPGPRGPVHLVVGQVDDDAAITLGTGEVNSNAALLRTVRERNPEAFLVFKPHPDVLAGNRKGALCREVLELADWVESSRAIAACLDVSETVHTMTSLVGFEALLRNLKVETYGVPFYAGWGLTRDFMKCARRTRRLTLEELVFACLELYPRYYSDSHGCFVSAREAIVELANARDAHGRGTVGASSFRQLRRLKRYFLGLLNRA